MRYNEKYDLYVSNSGLIYKLNKDRTKLIYCKTGYTGMSRDTGYRIFRGVRVHRIIWETFNGEIPDGMEIDHINTIRNDNRLENLRLVTHKENMNNPLSRKYISKALERNTNAKGKIHSEFGNKFKEHFNITMSEDIKLYKKEWLWYRNHNNKCRWEV